MSSHTSSDRAAPGDSVISDEQLGFLREDFARLDAFWPGLADAIVEYVVNGHGQAVLDRLAATPGCGRALDLAGCSMVAGVNRAARTRFFANPPAADPRFFVRLAQVYHAAALPDRIVTPNYPSLGLPNWIELFLWEATSSSPYLYSSAEPKIPFRADVMEQVLVASGEPAGLLTRAVMMPAPKTGSVNALRRVVCLQGFAAMAARYPAVIDEALGQAEADRRIHVLDLLLKREIDPSPFAARIVELAVCAQKTVRQAAEPLVAKVSTVVLPFIRAKAENGTSDERALAAQLLWRIAGEAARNFLADRALNDPSAKVKEVVGSLLIESKPVRATLDDDDGLAPVAPVERVVPLTPEARTAFTELVHDAWKADSTRSQRFSQCKQAPPPLDETAISDGIDFIEGKKGVNSPDFARAVRKRLPPPGPAMWDSAGKLASRTDLNLIHVVRLASLLQATDAHFPYLLKTFASHYYFSHKPRFSLRQLAATVEAAGHDPEYVRKAMFSGPQAPEGFLAFDAADVWPYFAEHPEDLLLRWHQKEDYAFLDDRKREVIVKILAMFPIMPPPFSRLCWDVAFGGTKKIRSLAQAALANEAGKAERIQAALAGRNAEHRSIAAAWLASLGSKEAIPALKQALAREKHEPTAGAIMVALESLGVPLDEFINTDGMLKEAQVLLAKGVPKELSSIDLDHLPRVRRAQSGKPVRQEILQWMIVQSYKLKSPEPGPRLRQHASYFDRADAEEFGQHVLESWIARETIPHTAEQAHEAAEEFANQMAGFAQQYPQQFPGTKADWYRQAYNQKLQEPVGSAQNEKGVLAVAGAFCGPRAVLVVERYLKTYYGYRAHQCRALIRMLSWIDHPSAIQLLLSVSSRFRTAGIRKEAEACVKELAERKEWTIAELADRTIPTAGFDDALQLVLDFGSRTFTASLDDELKLVLRTDDGKAIKTLPAPRKDDDAAKATAAKKALSAARKEIDSVLKHQKDRLYESMCTQRTWAFSDWDQFLNRHPIIRHYCQRLIWWVTNEGKLQQTFRPLGDGTLTDAADHAVTVASGAHVRLAHESIVPAETITLWRQHLADYGVNPLFDQFGRGGFQLPEGRRAESTLNDFRGHLLEAFKLRGRLTKLGYTRGPTGDGGWFYSYDKRFPSVGITATIEFTGNGLPEENKTVALTSLQFTSSSGSDDPSTANTRMNLALGDVPQVLLSECWNDMRLAASDGPGYVADWEKKTTS